MPTLLGRYSEHFYATARIVIGLLFACHGAQKLFGVLGGTRQLGDPEGLFAGGIELVGGSLVAIGLAGSVAAFVASGEMAVAYFRAHAPIGFWPIQNGGEWAVLYCFFFLYVAAKGSGRFSPDSLIHRHRAALAARRCGGKYERLRCIVASGAPTAFSSSTKRPPAKRTRFYVRKWVDSVWRTGVSWPRATASISCESVSQPRCTTRSTWRNAGKTYPLPNTTAPIFRNSKKIEPKLDEALLQVHIPA